MTGTEDKTRWAQLLSYQRLYKTDIQNDPFSDEMGRTKFDADFGRLVFSSQYRRLQDKTQVFPLATSDYTRTRLTHTMEVATVGQTLGKGLGKLLAGQGVLPDDLSPADVGTVVGVACLAHDLGNPPFGHSGESAIQEWTERNRETFVGVGIKDDQLQDFLSFEGNAQSFRITARLWGRDRPGGGQLTLASYGALLKYPQGSGHERNKTEAARKKFNYFKADETLVGEVGTALQLHMPERGRFARHPLVYLMEAADDICYRIIDMEDAYDAKLITKQNLCQLLQPFLSSKLASRSAAQLEQEEVPRLRADAIGTLVQAVMGVVRDNLDALREGEFNDALVDALKVSQPKLYEAFEKLGEAAKKEVYVNDRVLQVEYVGFKVIGGLLNEFLSAIDLEGKGQLSDSARKLLTLFPRSYLVVRPDLHEGYKNIKHEDLLAKLTPYERVLALTDYVSGMTDSFALDLYRKLTGVRLPD